MLASIVFACCSCMIDFKLMIPTRCQQADLTALCWPLLFLHGQIIAHIAHMLPTFQLERKFQPVLYVHNQFEAQNAHRLLTRRLFSCIVASIVIGEPTGSPQGSQLADVPTGELYPRQYCNWAANRKLPMLIVCRRTDCTPVL